MDMDSRILELSHYIIKGESLSVQVTIINLIHSISYVAPLPWTSGGNLWTFPESTSGFVCGPGFFIFLFVVSVIFLFFIVQMS